MAKDYAPGLPSKTHFGDPHSLKPGSVVDFIVQQHKAERAGTHFDVRFGTPDTGLFSWATRKELPKPGERIALFQQPLHRHEYKEFEGEIAEGYGKGHVSKHDEGKLLITRVSTNAIHFTKAHKKNPERFVLRRPNVGDKRWLLMNTTPTEPIPYEKLHYSKISPDDAEKVLQQLPQGSSVQAKIDGAASLTKFQKGRVEIASYRAAKETGHPIIHTERVLGGTLGVDYPKELEGTVVRGELYGVRGGKAIPPQELGGILNSSVTKALKTQQDRGIALKNMVFDIQRLGGKLVTSLPYERRMELVKKVMSHLPGETFHTPDQATTAEEAVALFKKIRSGEHPLTQEGVVIHHPGKKPSKIKFTEEHDVYVTGVFPGEGKLKGKGVGGFTYSLKPGGKTVGKVGTGFSEELRRDMHSSPEDFIGRVAKVRAQEKLPSGALRAPALLSFHEDYPMKKLSKKHVDRLPGGKADRDEPSDFPKEQIRMGVKVEREHTKNPAVAKEIAMDHLTEGRDYYTRLRKMEEGMSKSKEARITGFLDELVSIMS